MDVKDLRIGAMVKTKSLMQIGDKPPKVEELDKYGCVILKIDGFNSMEFSIQDIEGVKVTKELLSSFGGWYDDKKVEHIFTFKGGLRIAVRPQVGSENYSAARIGEYKPKYCKFTYIHTFQYWLWDMYKVEL